jgi:undecaprenyl-diphosphatase
VIDFLYSIDVAVFRFLNTTIANPAGDVLWPIITDYNKQLPIQILLIGVWLWLMIRGGARGRTAALMVIPVLVVSDQLSSTFIKAWIGRIRPCAEVGGIPVVPGIRMLVDCGPGKSFPSSHAVNNFAIATMFTMYYPRVRPWVFAFAALVALSRPAVGVHYPSDILGGAVIGTAVAFLLVSLWRWITEHYLPSIQVLREGGTGQ